LPFSHEPVFYDQEASELFWEINQRTDARRVISAGPAGGAAYILPVATAARLGGIKASVSVMVDADGTATVPDALTTAPGLVRLADLPAIIAGTAGRVVDAAQLKAAIAGVGGGGGGGGGTITSVRGTAPITVDNTDPLSPLLAVSAATTAAPGVVRLADAAAITAGTAGRVVDAAQLASRLSADLASLPSLP